ncbi:secD: protein-export membrane protein SecD [Rubrobacter radiotolerans]|uniref:Protein translocase subunit SecD n=1 Tax=Rubrobacter radiotolerans TaxID=42256 RepID=A0A023X361_RUBRA|nr:protein translocase subunit SecD [Rubrobacter radiotolerans]AHY46611.1 secD: protein-export membrane protein SecD [Rubrobacter radiotolerans]MDX5894018.1 protein translocase subunit SecD [Rubrobacter radiotolerans]SMC04979.1 preprotein translocase subunit SecD [Rubrobacter radiotolerans DSM 5868]
MNTLRNNLLILGLVVVLLAVAVYLIFIRQPVSEATQLGLDLEGGVRVQLQGFKEDGSPVESQEMARAIEVIRDRVDSLGVAEPDIRQQGADEALVDIPGVTDPDQAVEVIGRTAQLGFYRVIASDAEQLPPDATQEEIRQTEDDLRESLRSSSDFEEGATKVLFENTPDPAGAGTVVAGYIVSQEPQMTGDAVSPNGANINFDQTGRREVSIQLTGEGGRQFGELTQEIVSQAIADGAPGTGQLAIVLDDQVQSAPVVQEPIPGGQVSINNQGLPEGLPEEEATNLVTVLNSGALPVNMEVLSVQTIGPTLGAESLRGGLSAALAGLAFVLLFLTVIYRALGIVASLALLIYGVLLWGIIVAVPITMTLPGIAGIVLSVGVAADANIVIFERIKEEIRKGKTARTAIRAGYEKGFRAVLDGNITTLITAVILFALASAQVRGFAVLLAIGVLLSMFTAIVVTRALLGILSARRFQLSPAMMGVTKRSLERAAEENAAADGARGGRPSRKGGRSGGKTGGRAGGAS